MIEASCHCGAVRFEVETAPEEVTDCNCSICRRYGARWAYYSLAKVHFRSAKNATDIYMWGDRMLEFHRCKVCGCVTHSSPIDKSRDRMGVNARLMAPEVIAAARVRHYNGAEA